LDFVVVLSLLSVGLDHFHTTTASLPWTIRTTTACEIPRTTICRREMPFLVASLPLARKKIPVFSQNPRLQAALQMMVMLWWQCKSRGFQ
jgi:hypothetical protein